MLITRNLRSKIIKYLISEPRVIILYGPRQSGKTTLINSLLKELNREAMIFNGDDIRTQELFCRNDLNVLKKAVGNKKLLFIDEAQRIDNIGLSLKLIFDSLKIHIIATGSSSFDLSNKVSEPLTGRSVNLFLYPVSMSEAKPEPPDISYTPRLEEFMRYGLYPKVLTTDGEDEKQRYLYDLVNNYLYKDILTFNSVRKPKKVVDLLTLLALQIGSEVSVNELSNRSALSRQIVEKYLDLLEKMFVIVNLRGFSRNLRKEIYKTSKYYFLDTGLRNALIRNFNPLNLRNDTGLLFENLCIIERMKEIHNRGKFANFYFWRTYDKKEIDLIEERDGTLFGYEFKWSSKKKKSSAFKEFSKTYNNSKLEIISSNDIDRYIDTY